jgi:hypothetical protein
MWELGGDSAHHPPQFLLSIRRLQFNMTLWQSAMSKTRQHVGIGALCILLDDEREVLAEVSLRHRLLAGIPVLPLPGCLQQASSKT